MILDNMIFRTMTDATEYVVKLVLNDNPVSDEVFEHMVGDIKELYYIEYKDEMTEEEFFKLKVDEINNIIDKYYVEG